MAPVAAGVAVGAVDAGAVDNPRRSVENEKGRRHECPAAFDSTLVQLL